MQIILGFTGSVASTLHNKLAERLKQVGDVTAVLTETARLRFVDQESLNCKVLTDADEWTWLEGETTRNRYKKGDEVLHINISDNASALVIAPCSANVLAKLANGITDNLLTSIARSWDTNRPIIIAPAMNTRMWEHPLTNSQLSLLRNWGASIVAPQNKMLACGTTGVGAMADIDAIVTEVRTRLKWHFPLDSCTGIPTNNHPGAFLSKRKMHTHTGVDLYTDDGAIVYAMERGRVVGIENFTGPSDNTPWWEDTKCILVEGASGVICYGELAEPNIEVGEVVRKGCPIGHVKRVLKPGKERPDIPGHRLSMLHIELYPHKKYTAFEEQGNSPDSFDILRDPTPYLIAADPSIDVLTYEEP